MSLDREDDPDARTYQYSDSTLLKRMVMYLLFYKGLFAGVVVLTIVNITISIWAPFVLQHAIDVDFPSGDLNALLTTSLTYVILLMATWLSSYGQEYMMAKMGQRAVYDIRQDLYTHLQRMSEDFYDHSSSGRVISRLTNDVDRMSELLCGGLISTFAQIFIVFAIGIVIFSVDFTMALASLSIVPILLLSTIYFRKRLREAYRSTRKTISIVTANLAESISGAKVTKSFARERISAENFAQLNKADYESNVRAGKAQAAFFPMIRLISGSGIAVILFFGGTLYLTGAVTLGTIVLFVQFNDRFFRPILIIANFYTSVQSAFAGAERVFTIIDSRPSVHDAPNAVPLGEVTGHIRFNHVTFSYGDDVNVLEDFNLEIQPGETIALVGDTGAGKTTVVSLLNRFYDIQEGSIEIDGIDIRNVKQSSLRARIGLVLQDPFLFQGTVKDNIKYGKPDASDEEVLAAVEAIGAKRIIDNLDDGLDTEVGERGNRLSEGERQLVSFARALLADPKILVLDEATSSIDIYTEYAIQKGMRALLKDRTSIVIAHRLSTIVNADRILVLENGKIIEEGRHADLMALKGKYFSLYDLQIRPRAMQIR
ncbi:MAG: ABC transporter ATP-binding protein [Candidatus Thorarchaeota archaeon]|nr:MAG: ABC transporter ATP-binding protein [Candidatus Thorarchaeota archaeon]RLI59603.1 MAG: ABC transporter ATP-binding protein [Candidatus Thorarchaeota archaeon]